MSNYKILMTKQAQKESKNFRSLPALQKTVSELIELIADEPLKTPPYVECLVGDLNGLFSRRINKQHRLVYEIREQEKVVVILRMWSHYE